MSEGPFLWFYADLRRGWGSQKDPKQSIDAETSELQHPLLKHQFSHVVHHKSHRVCMRLFEKYTARRRAACRSGADLINDGSYP